MLLTRRDVAYPLGERSSFAVVSRRFVTFVREKKTVDIPMFGLMIV